MRVTREEASRILRDLPAENAFYFYRGVDRPILLHSRNLNEFISILKIVEGPSLDFHLGRGDFENWIGMLGDPELLERVRRLHGEALPPEEFRDRLIKIVRSRILQLAKTAKAKPQNSGRQR